LKYPANFSQDLKELSVFYGWNDGDKKDVKKSFEGSEEMVKFFTTLAAAHRAGYTQHAGNGFIRLQLWCIGHGVGDPFGNSFDLAALDALKVSA
jgi:hypothetical protein